MPTAKTVVSTLLTLVLALAGITSIGLSPATAATTPSIVEVTIGNVVYTADTRSPGLGATVSGWTYSNNMSQVATVRSRVTIKGVGYPVTTIGKSAFFQSPFNVFTLPNSITSIGQYAFTNSSTSELVIPNSVTEIGDYAFYQGYFPNPRLGTGLKTIGRYAFMNAGVRSVTIPNSVTSIGEGAFMQGSVTSLTLGNNVASIGGRAFMQNGLSSVTIPASVTTIGYQAFSESGVHTLTLSSGLKTIEWGAFRNNSISSVVIPDSVTSIGEQAFNSAGVTSLTLGSSVETIGTAAFKYCGITSLVIPDSVTTIGNQAFMNNRIASLTFGDSLETIGAMAFSNNSNSLSGDLVFPDSVSSIGHSAFRSSGNFDSVVLPDGLTEIAAYTFESDLITSVTIPDSVTTIGEYAFYAAQLDSVTLPSSLVSIGDYAFTYSEFTSVTLPPALTTIGDFAFAYVPLESLTVPDSVTSIGIRSFVFNSIASLTLGKSLTTIGTEAFVGHKVSTLNIPDSVTTIGNWAFSGNGESLSEVWMSRSITSIGSFAFTTGNPDLVIRMMGTTPPTTISGASSDGPSFSARNVLVYYPTSTPDNYGANWQGYSTQPIIGVLFDSNGHGDNPGAQFTTGVASYAVPGQSDPSGGAATFQGWYTQRVGGTKITFPYTVTGMVTLYAQWGTSFAKTATPTIAGTAKVGETLTAHSGTWSPDPTLSYEWRRSGSTDVIATGSTYVLTPDDFNRTITVTLTASSSGYQTQVVASAATSLVAAAAFSLTPTPTIVGTAAAGKLLRASVGEWAEPAGFTYTWKATTTATTPVTTTVGTGETYTVAGTDVGKKITLTVTATLSGYTTKSVVSAATPAVATGTFASSPVPTISGTVQSGQVLTAVTGTWSNSPTFTYQWKSSASTTAILGTAARYTVGAADIGKTLTVTVTATKAGFITTSKTSVVSAAVLSAAFDTAPTPTISGTPKFGQQLAAVTGTWSNSPTLTYQWKSSASTTAILGTLATYTPAATDIGKTLTVTVTATKAGFITTSKTSAVTFAVAAESFVTTPAPTLSGTTTVNSTLTAGTTGWDPSAGVTFTYVWKQSATSGGTGTVISGASLSTYKLLEADRGKFITVTVTAAKTGYISVTKTSLPTAAIG